MSLITIDQALAHLNLTVEATDHRRLMDVSLKLAQAEAIVIDYCNSTAYWRAVTVTWTSATLPAVVQAAIMVQFAELWRFRGDEADGQGPAQTIGGLSPVVVNLLMRSRDPVVI